MIIGESIKDICKIGKYHIRGLIIWDLNECWNIILILVQLHMHAFFFTPVMSWMIIHRWKRIVAQEAISICARNKRMKMFSCKTQWWRLKSSNAAFFFCSLLTHHDKTVAPHSTFCAYVHSIWWSIHKETPTKKKLDKFTLNVWLHKCRRILQR